MSRYRCRATLDLQAAALVLWILPMAAQGASSAPEPDAARTTPAAVADSIVKLVPIGATVEEFGRSVALDGDRAAVLADAPPLRPGTAFLYERDAGGPGAWGEVARITGEDPQADFRDGVVALEGGRLAVGTPHDLELGFIAGAVFIFQRDAGGPGNWGQVAKITAADGGDSDRFGSAVAIDGDTLAVGAEGVASSRGAAYIFRRNGGMWDQIARLSLADAETFDFFGSAVALRGDTLFVAAVRRDAIRLDSGAVFVFERDAGGPDNWGEVAELTVGGLGFGYRLALDGDTILVAQEVGESLAYLFERDVDDPYRWLLAATVTDPLARDGGFGEGVALRGDLAVVGADSSNLLRGSVAVFTRDAGGADAWGQTARLAAPDGTPGDRFGAAVAVGGMTVLAGSPSDGDGSAYVIDLETVAPVLLVSGECPGTVRVDLSLAAPNQRVALAGSFSEGDSAVPGGACAGTKLGLADPVALGTARSDALGGLALEIDLGEGPCGAFLQAVDLASCRPSNVHRLPAEIVIRYDPGSPAEFFRSPLRERGEWVGNLFDTAVGSPLGSGYLSAVQAYLRHGSCPGTFATIAVLPFPSSPDDTVRALTSLFVPLPDLAFRRVELPIPLAVPPRFMLAHHLIRYASYYDGCITSGGSLGMHNGTVMGQGHHGFEARAYGDGRGGGFQPLNANAMIRATGTFDRKLLPVELMNPRLEEMREAPARQASDSAGSE